MDPQTGGFTYMTPLMSGAAREYSSPADNAFWCCVGTGMESHAKHGDSIFWEGDDGTLYVNLYIPSEARWAARGVRLELDTRYPFEPEIRLSLPAVRDGRFALALRIPAWAGAGGYGKRQRHTVRRTRAARLRNARAHLARGRQCGAVMLPLALRTEADAW